MGLIGTPDWNWAVSNAEVPIWIGSPSRGPNWRSIRVQVLIVGLGLLSVSQAEAGVHQHGPCALYKRGALQ